VEEQRWGDGGEVVGRYESKTVSATVSRCPAAMEPTKRLFLRIRALMRRAFSAALLSGGHDYLNHLEQMW
jgi:hypothetical protein